MPPQTFAADPAGNTDITGLILADHNWFRWQFAELDYLQAAAVADRSALNDVWQPLSMRLDLHADIEEQIFYPELLRLGADDPVAETLDAIGDHNDIRDGIREANLHAVGSTPWWDGVRAARLANDDHMSEEEHEGLADMRRHAPGDLLASLGQRYLDYFARHPTTAGVDISDTDPTTYVARIEQTIDENDQSLHIGSLRNTPRP